MRNKMAVITTPGKVEFTQKDVRAPGAGEVLVQIRASGICGGDLHLFADKHPMVSLPAYPGHEFSGDVVELGVGVNNLCVGDRVAVEPVLVCGGCKSCRLGEYGYCENISFAYRRGDGAMASWFVARAEYTYKLPDSLSYDAGAMLEPTAVAVHAVRRADIQMGQSVLITGAGTIGILIAALCKSRGAGEIIVTDLSDTRLGLARSMGATQTVNTSSNNLEDTLAALGLGSGVDQAFECVGHPIPLNQCILALRANGCLTILGLSHQEMIELPVTRIVTKELRIQGSQGYCHDFALALEMMEKQIDVEKLITHRFALDDIQQAFELAQNRNSGALKVMIHPPKN